MFYKVFTKQVYSFIPLNSNIFVKTCRLLCGNSSKDVNNPLLHDRFINFFRKDDRYSLFVVHNSEKEMYPIKKTLSGNETIEQLINNMPVVKLPLFLHNLATHKHVIPSQDLRRILLLVDDLYSTKLSCMGKATVLKCVSEWHNICQGNTMTTKLYQEFMNTVSIWLTKRDNSLEILVFVMFYIGLSKKLKVAQYLIQKCLNEIDMFKNLLTVDELCIICSSSFKCSVPIKSSALLQCICTVMEMNSDSLVSDPAYIVTFVKSLRLAKCYNFCIMDKIASKNHFDKIFKMTFTAKIHILAMYAEALYDRKPFISLLIQSCIQNVNPTSVTNQCYSTIRMKDISRFLWAVSYLGHRLSHEDLKEVINVLQRSISDNHHLKIPEHTLGSLLSLWIMGLREPKLFKDAVTEDFMKILKETYPFRIQSRLSLLLTCIQIEMPALLCDEHSEWTTKNIIPEEALKKHLQRRTFLKQIFIAVTNLRHQMKLQAVCECSIPNLNILGITVTSHSGKELHIEVLDAAVCLYETHTPNGLMKLKLRLLENQGLKVLVIREDKFDAVRNTSEIYIFLEEKLARHLNRHGT